MRHLAVLVLLGCTPPRAAPIPAPPRAHTSSLAADRESTLLSYPPIAASDASAGPHPSVEPAVVESVPDHWETAPLVCEKADRVVGSTTMTSTTWTRRETGLSVALNDVWASSARDAWIVGDAGTLLHTRDVGGSFDACTLSTSGEDLRAVAGVSADEVWVAGARGLYRILDGGRTFARYVTSEEGNGGGGALHLLPSGQVFVTGLCRAGETCLFADTTDGGATFTFHGSSPGRKAPSPGEWRSLAFVASPKELWLKVPFEFMHSSDGGESWTEGFSPGTEDNVAIGGSSASDVWVVRGYGTASHSVDGGATWSTETVVSTTDQTLATVWTPGGGLVWAGGDGIFVRGKGGWAKEVSGARVSRIWGRSAADVWAVGPDGVLLHRP